MRPLQQGDQLTVSLLWCSDGEKSLLLDVYTHKVQAEADMRTLRQDNYQGYIYSVSERTTVPHNNHKTYKLDLDQMEFNATGGIPNFVGGKEVLALIRIARAAVAWRDGLEFSGNPLCEALREAVREAEL